MYKSGISAATLARMYAVAEWTIKTRLGKHGGKTRTLSEAQSIWQKGKRKSEEHRRKLSIAKTGKPAPKPPDFGKYLSARMNGKVGASHPSWRGGKTPLRNEIRRWTRYKDWRDAVYNRDDYTCQECNGRGGDLQAHHIVPVNKILRDNAIKTAEQALRCNQLWDISNGDTLCEKCHPKVEVKQNGHWTGRKT